MRDLITSTANPQVKRIRSLLRSRKDRHSERMFVAEGVRLVEEALGHGDPACLLYDAAQLADTPRGAALLERLERHPAAYPVHPAILRDLTDVEAPQGVVAALPWPALSPPQVALALILDGVQDPGNAGTLLRSAEAAGADLVLALKGSADLWSPKVVRAGMGAHLRLPILVDLDWPAARAALGGARIYAATQDADLPYDAADWRQPAALAVGNEANGVSAETRAAAQPITIPMLGQVESLNAAVAGSVILFEAARQRR
ncbi:MAG TPA: RNA methyltransferase [Herpetosiphonaceae bacterium]